MCLVHRFAVGTIFTSFKLPQTQALCLLMNRTIFFLLTLSFANDVFAECKEGTEIDIIDPGHLFVSNTNFENGSRELYFAAPFAISGMQAYGAQFISTPESDQFFFIPLHMHKKEVGAASLETIVESRWFLPEDISLGEVQIWYNSKPCASLLSGTTYITSQSNSQPPAAGTPRSGADL